MLIKIIKNQLYIVKINPFWFIALRSKFWKFRNFNCAGSVSCAIVKLCQIYHIFVVMFIKFFARCAEVPCAV